jgi:hypothetical protein
MFKKIKLQVIFLPCIELPEKHVHQSPIVDNAQFFQKRSTNLEKNRMTKNKKSLAKKNLLYLLRIDCNKVSNFSFV